MSDDLYQEALVALAKSGTGAGRLEDPDGTATADNPLCGDRVTVDLRMEDGAIAELAQHTRGCLLTKAAAALVAEHAPGMAAEEASRLAAEVRQWLAGKGEAAEWLGVMAPVRDVRSRHDCVLIAFEALAEALAKTGEQA